MKPMTRTLFEFYGHLEKWLDNFQAIALLSARLYVSWIFFASGLTKIRDWDSTLYLFQEEYRVPLLSPELAAYLGTGGELLFPILLSFGLFGRIGAVGLFAVNIVAVQSLPEIDPAAYALHVTWGVLLGVITLFGAGVLSVDTVLRRYMQHG